MSDFINENAEIFNEDEEVKKTNIFVRIIKWLGLAVIFFIIGCLLYRCATHRFEPDVSDKIIMTEEFLEICKTGNEKPEIRKYGIQKPWVDVLERQGRLMEFKYLYHIPSTHQLLVTLKYNSDIVPEAFDTLPEKGTSLDMTGIPFEIALRDETGREYTDFVFETAERERFRYIRLCFNGVDIETGETDGDGEPLRHTLFVKLKMITDDGSFTDLCLGGIHKIYDGKDIKNNVFDKVKYKIEQ